MWQSADLTLPMYIFEKIRSEKALLTEVPFVPKVPSLKQTYVRFVVFYVWHRGSGCLMTVKLDSWFSDMV